MPVNTAGSLITPFSSARVAARVRLPSTGTGDPLWASCCSSPTCRRNWSGSPRTLPLPSSFNPTAAPGAASVAMVAASSTLLGVSMNSNRPSLIVTVPTEILGMPLDFPLAPPLGQLVRACASRSSAMCGELAVNSVMLMVPYRR